MKRYVPVALAIAFFVIGFAAFTQSRPSPKNARVYAAIKPCEPYYVEKRLGGLTILSNTDPTWKLKPDNDKFFRVLEGLERQWASKALKRRGDVLLIYDTNGSLCTRLTLQNDEERRFVTDYFGVAP